jgi:FkbM family methyltransferase
MNDDDILYVVEDCEFNLRNGSPSDRMVVNEVFIEGDYGQLDDIPEGGIILDIGANIGSFAIYAAKRTSCRIIAVEPEPSNFEKLKEHVSLNNFQDRIECVKLAVSKESGLNVWIDDRNGNSSIEPIESLKHNIPVLTTTLDDIIGSDEIAFLKMDTEGSEYLIFEGLNDHNLSRVKRIAMEYHEYVDEWGPMVRRLTKYHNVSLSSANPGGYLYGGMLFAELR